MVTDRPRWPAVVGLVAVVGPGGLGLATGCQGARSRNFSPRRLAEAHAGLIESQQPAVSPERMAEILAELAALDPRHDDLIRAVYYRLTAESHLAETEEERARLLALRDHLLPGGLSATTQSYRIQAGQAALLDARLTPGDRTALEAFPIGGTTMRQVVEEWLALAARIGALEDERTPAVAGNGDPQGEVRTARNRWIRTIRTVLQVLDLMAAEDEQVARILARVAEVERRATRRARLRREEIVDGDGAGDGIGVDDLGEGPDASASNSELN